MLGIRDWLIGVEHDTVVPVVVEVVLDPDEYCIQCWMMWKRGNLQHGKDPSA